MAPPPVRKDYNERRCLRLGRNQVQSRKGSPHMKSSFNIAENGDGPYRLLAILRWVMVLIFVSFGIQKFTLQSAEGIVQFISNSPFISWLSVFGLRGEAYFLGVAELGIAALLAAGAFNPIFSLNRVGSRRRRLTVGGPGLFGISALAIFMDPVTKAMERHHRHR
jgi:hypothetical protein